MTANVGMLRERLEKVRSLFPAAVRGPITCGYLYGVSAVVNMLMANPSAQEVIRSADALLDELEREQDLRELRNQ